LAHGLDLALKTLRHALQHGKNTVQKAVLVVVSDGRGNVPLEASHVGKIKLPVGKKGVEDALEVAEKLVI
jgi:Mg-chelatase subunit ChlD